MKSDRGNKMDKRTRIFKVMQNLFTKFYKSKINLQILDSDKYSGKPKPKTSFDNLGRMNI